MILVRDIFHLKFGKAKDAKILFKEGIELTKKYGFEKGRSFTDLVTNHSYTLIKESEWESLSAWENSMKNALGAEERRVWYEKFIPLVESASREILNILE
jgi:hypothetical protein